MISVKDMYTIYTENVKQYRLGDVIEFMLLTRQKDSFNLALKNKQGMCSVEEVHNSFSKFTFTSDVDLSVREVISELDNWLARADSNLVDDLSMLPYVCAAREQLEQRKTNWNVHQACNGDDTSANSSGHTRSPLAKNLMPEILSFGVNDKPTGFQIPGHNLKDGETCMAQVSDAIGSPEVCDEVLSSPCNDDKSVQMQANDFQNKKENDSYNFYQAVDGQHLILHSINLKCLLHNCGSYGRLPHRIHGKILQLETVTQSEAMRKRYRYLSHFSLTTPFQLCEIELSDSLPLDALSLFIDEIKNREKQRKRVARKEQEEKIKAEVASATEILTRPYNFSQPSHDFSPNFFMDDFEALGSSAVVSVSPPAMLPVILVHHKLICLDEVLKYASYVPKMFPYVEVRNHLLIRVLPSTAGGRHY
ncbi:RING finger protein 10 [Heracleum sosnowskyi]|uniref:RING finger protein 10 n=1 Tax=Heracleum sosnowskyi TaxID=360622 RepID=A0AAD8HM26_9APIA|nr:RING finger protein 10 [Heracleum sosnowskyi]